MENLLLPFKIEFNEGTTPNTGSVSISPCYHGYGTTLGNAYRRVLLSSLPGAAVEAFKIRGVQHEFSTMEGVKEDITEIMLNLKQLVVKVYSDEPVILNLVKKGSGPVTAKDIEKNSNVDIINKDLVIANITGAKNTLEMEITVGRGRGFKPVEQKDRKNYDLGTIVVDSIYTPVRDVGYRVEYTRVGDITNYEKLTLNIETNGTISVFNAMEQANQILMDHFTIIMGGVKEAVEGTPVEEVKTEEVVEEAPAKKDKEEVVEEPKKEKKAPKAKKAVKKKA